jgi:lipopolysaccharide/colanic/teichoic acid biosynthesis glycosyltransferase
MTEKERIMTSPGASPIKKSDTGYSQKTALYCNKLKNLNKISLYPSRFFAVTTFSRVFDKLLALWLLIITSPLFLLIPLAVKASSRGTVFYSGTRLGKGKKTFMMYKFRTLPEDFQQKNGAKLVCSKDRISPFFRFLRDSRLDELPQLWNVIRGDMNFIGPRPERTEVYEEKCRHIKNYDIRFEIRPGLIGYSQLFTPHSTPKRMRVLFDNRFITKSRTPHFDPLCLYALPMLLRNMLDRALPSVRNIVQTRILLKFNEKRKEGERIRQQNASVYSVTGSHSKRKILLGELYDINKDTLQIITDRLFCHQRKNISQPLLVEKCLYSSKASIKKKIIRCKGKVSEIRRRNDGSYAIIMKYTPSSPLTDYKISQYLLNQSIIPHYSETHWRDFFSNCLEGLSLNFEKFCLDLFKQNVPPRVMAGSIVSEFFCIMLLFVS